MKYQLKTLTPTSILDGNELSPIGDYFIDQSMVNYIDHTKVERFVENRPDLLDSLVHKTKASINNTKVDLSFDKDVIVNIFKSNPKDFIKLALPLKGLDHASRMLIKTIIKTAGKPFIPGSSIKGAFKTALLYDWLMNNNNGNKVVETLIYNINNNIHINNRDLDLDSKFQKQLKKYSHIRISDTTTCSNDVMFVIKIHRLHLTNKNKQGMIPIVIESVMPNSKFSFDIDLSHKNNNCTIQELIEKVTTFNRETLYFEEDLLNEAEEDVIDGNTFNSIMDNYEFLDNSIYNNFDKMYLRLGFGKSNLNNSILLAIYKKDKEAFMKYRKVFNLGEKDSKFFPLTRAIAVHNNSQLGWVEISII